MCMEIGLMWTAQAYFTPEVLEVSHITDQDIQNDFDYQ